MSHGLYSSLLLLLLTFTLTTCQDDAGGPAPTAPAPAEAPAGPPLSCHVCTMADCAGGPGKSEACHAGDQWGLMRITHDGEEGGVIRGCFTGTLKS